MNNASGFGKSRPGIFGSFTGFMMLVVMVIASIGFMLYFSGSSTVVKDNMDDLNKLSEASTYGDYFENDFFPQSINLSQQRASYNIGKEGVSFDTGDVPGNVVPKLKERLDSRTDSKFEGYILKAENSISCGVEADYSVDTGKESTEISSSEAPSVSCKGSKVEANYSFPGRMSFDGATKYYETAEELRDLLEKTEDNLHSEKITREGSADSGCSVDPDETQVNSDARSNAKGNAKSAFNSKSDSLPDSISAEGIDLLSISRTSYNPPSSDGNIVSSKTTDCPDKCESRDEEGDCENWIDREEYEATAEYTLEEVEVPVKIENNRGKLLNSEGAKYLEFNSIYTHLLD